MSTAAIFTPPQPLISPSGSSNTQQQQQEILPYQQPPPYADTSPSPSSTTSIILVIIIIASAVIVTASIYILLRFLSRRFHLPNDVVSVPDPLPQQQQQQQCHVTATNGNLLGSLPLFTFRSIKGGNLTGGDCAVCLSKFEPDDQLRLLPLCCHAFHATCIDAWILSNHTCPLCRSSVLPSDADKLLSADHHNRSNNGSFRIEIGSISSRRGGGPAAASEEDQRSYSIGSFDYIVDDSNGYEVSVDSTTTTTHRRGISDCTDKESSIGVPVPPDALAAEVAAGGRNWLRDYVDRLASVSLSSRALSFRSSGRFFSGSSRRTEPMISDDGDLEANHRVGEEISELFQWLSGI